MIIQFSTVILAGALSTGIPAAAAELPMQAASVTEMTPEPIVAAPITPADIVTLSDSDLDAQRGGETLMLTNQTLVAITSGNVINGNYAAGAVSLSDFALSNFNGVGNLLINTGAQVSLQTAMNLTINVGD